MSRIELSALRADLPIGAMVAFGCLRICERSEGLRGTKLGWATAGGSFVAVLSLPRDAGERELLECLIGDAQSAVTRRELTWRPKLKGLGVSEFREMAGDAIDAADARNPTAAEWFAAFATDVVPDGEEVEATPLDMTGGPQEFLGGVLDLASKISSLPRKRKAKRPEESFREALFGPWRYDDDQHSLGWDPSTIKLGAFTYQAPTKMANSGVAAAVWLAFESMPLFSCFTVQNKLAVRAFSRNRREYSFLWPVWKEPIGLDELSYLLSLDLADTSALPQRGVTAVYRSRRFYLNKYYASFRAPELVFGGVSAAAG